MREEKSRGEIYIHQPYVQNVIGRSRLSATIDFRGESREVWFEVAEAYGGFLCEERSDAFLIGLLNFAMREGCDIRCEAPVTAQLLYQIRTYLIPSLVRNSNVLYATQIETPMSDEALPNAGGVGTGISCGIDSLHAIKNYMNSPYPGLKLTHLTINNVGAFGTHQTQYDWQTAHAMAFAKEYNFELIVTNSNFAEMFPQDHLLTHTYSSCFAIYALQKLWSVYFYASAGYDYQEAFSLTDNEKKSSDHYELLSLDTFSIRTLKIYSEGAAINRFEKTQDLVYWEAAQKYLHVCTSNQGENCGRCAKCLRTLVTLDALGELQHFDNVFDVLAYEARRTQNLQWLYRQTLSSSGDIMIYPAYEIMRHKISFVLRVRTRISLIWWKYYGMLTKIKPLYRVIHPLFNAIRRMRGK